LEILPKTTMPAAMDDLVKLVGDPVRSVRDAAVLALVRLAPEREETIAALGEALQEVKAGNETSGTATFSREDAALTLAKLGPKAKAAVPELTRLLTDQNDYTREVAATALWRINRDPATPPILAECLDEARDYQTCVRLLRLLTEMGKAAGPAVPAIIKRVEDPGVNFAPPNVDISQLALDPLTKIAAAAAAAAKKKLELVPAGKP
jgi:HEAT repeat protein